MAVLKIRDAEGNIVEIPCIKGDNYVLTEADKQEIAEMVINALGSGISTLSSGDEVAY